MVISVQQEPIQQSPPISIVVTATQPVLHAMVPQNMIAYHVIKERDCIRVFAWESVQLVTT
jgi:hypothetical protein